VLSVNSGAIAPEWVDLTNVTQDNIFNATGYVFSPNTERDVPDSSLVVTVPVTSTIIVYGQLTSHISSLGKSVRCWVNVDGTNYDTHLRDGETAINTGALFGVFEGVSAGDITVKLRELAEFSGHGWTVTQFAYSVIVISEF